MLCIVPVSCFFFSSQESIISHSTGVRETVFRYSGIESEVPCRQRERASHTNPRLVALNLPWPCVQYNNGLPKSFSPDLPQTNWLIAWGLPPKNRSHPAGRWRGRRPHTCRPTWYGPAGTQIPLDSVLISAADNKNVGTYSAGVDQGSKENTLRSPALG